MSDVFVSYKSEDRKRVKHLVDALEADGYSVWWDEQIGGGAAWRREIEVELNVARCVIVAWSKHSVGPDGTFVQDEATRAQQRHVYIPVTIDKVHLPLGFGETQALPLTGWHGDRSDPRYQSVLASVRRIAGDRATGPLAQRDRQLRVSRRVVLAGGGVAVAAVSGVGAWLLFKPGSADASNSIAVLPFANLSGDAAQAYFSDGIAEELRSALSRIGMEVIGRASSDAVKDLDTKVAAAKLGVANILTGSVRRSPSVVRVSAQLVDGQSGLERWSERYDRAPGDAIRIQTDIAENVARALSIALDPAQSELTAGGTENAAALNLALQAQEANRENSKAGTQRAVQLIDAALRIDPDFAAAYAHKAHFMNRLGVSFASGSAELAHFRGEAFRLAKKAVGLAPMLPIAHFALARVYDSNLEIANASAEYQKALRLAPGDASLLRRYSYFVSRNGDVTEGIRLADKAIELDPLNPDSYENRVGALFDARRYQEAVHFAEETRRKSPDLLRSPTLLGDCLQMLGRYREAQQQYSLGRPDQYERLTGEALLLARTGDREGAERKLQRMQQIFGDAASYQYGEIYTQLGDRDRALAALERAWVIRDGGLNGIRIDPMLDPLRGDPRFERIVKRMNFPA
jgi:TolB-like protein/Tfp pilus assembly protein PilF